MDKLPQEIWDFYISSNMSRVSLLLVSGTSHTIRAMVRAAVEHTIEKNYRSRVLKQLSHPGGHRHFTQRHALAKVVRESVPLAVLLMTEFTDHMSLQLSAQFVLSVARELTSSLLAYFPPRLLRTWWETEPGAAFDGYLWNLKSAYTKSLRCGMAQERCLPPVVLAGTEVPHLAVGHELAPVAWGLVAGDLSTLTPDSITAIKKENARVLFMSLAALSGHTDTLESLAAQLETLPEGLSSWPEEVVLCALMGSDATAAFVASGITWTPRLITQIFEVGVRDIWDRMVRTFSRDRRHVEAVLLPVFFELWRVSDAPPTKLLRWLDDRGFLNAHSIEAILRPLMESYVPRRTGGKTKCGCPSHVLYRYLISEPFNFFTMAELGCTSGEVMAKRDRIMKNAGYQYLANAPPRYLEGPVPLIRPPMRLRREEAAIMDDAPGQQHAQIVLRRLRQEAGMIDDDEMMEEEEVRDADPGH